MANTFELINSYAVSSPVSFIDFTSIPSSYTDLCLQISARSSRTGGVISASITMELNNSTSSFTSRNIEGAGSGTPSSTAGSTNYFGIATTESSTSNTFTSLQIYIPSYASSNYKTISVDNAHENNGTAAYAYLWAGLWSNTSAINQITLKVPGFNFVQYSTAYLYGIKNS